MSGRTLRGSKRERSPGVWELRVYLGQDPVTGRERQKSRTFRGTAAKADTALAALVTEAQKMDRQATEGTFGRLLDEWLAFVDRDLERTTARDYRSICDKYLRPELGSKRIDRLTPTHFNRLYYKLQYPPDGKDGLSPARIQRVHAVARKALNEAVEWGWLAANPALRAKRPKAKKPDVEPPALEILDRLVAAATEKDPDMGRLLKVAASLGARRGELAGLQWRDIDWATGEVRIRRAVGQIKRDVFVKDTKTHQQRRVTLEADVLAMLRAHRTDCEARADLAGVTLGPQAFVWSREPDGSTPVPPEIITGFWVRLCDQEKVEGVRLHDLRHLNASLLLQSGVPISTVSKRLGHAQTSTTLDVYSHLLPGDDAAAAAALGRALNPVKANQ